MAETIRLRIDDADAASLITNFWQTALARRGLFFLSSDAGAFHLLVPRQHEGTLRDLRTAREVVVSRGPLTLDGRTLPDALEVLFDDHTDEPWSLHLAPDQVDRMPLDTDSTSDWVCTVWRRVVGLRGRQVLSLPAHYRRSLQLPDLRPWQA